MESFLMKKYDVSKEDIGKSLSEFYHCKFIQFDDKFPIPGDLLKNLKREYLRRELWVPLWKTDDKIQVFVDHPSNILNRDMLEILYKILTVQIRRYPSRHYMVGEYHFVSCA